MKASTANKGVPVTIAPSAGYMNVRRPKNMAAKNTGCIMFGGKGAKSTNFSCDLSY
jgi:hypothetical protein